MKNNSNINNSIIDKSAQNVLNMIDRMANSDDERKRKSIPSLIIITDDGYEMTAFGKKYGKIIETSKLFDVKGLKTFLELVFPKDNPRDESLFYSSPQRVASIRNRFYGTMLISFEEFKGSDLLQSESFKNLLGFIEENKENIRFIFRVLPGFTMKKQLATKLGENLNILEVVIEKPQNEVAYGYVLRELKELNYRVDEANVELLKQTLSQIIRQENYCGYKTLNNVIKKINYEMMISENSNDGIITSETIEKLGWKLAEEISLNKTENRIGFHI